ncbi:energy transducer TonB [Winogradskyella sp. F6397]|uniref:Energy transducer TonB n=1 Tax=Winogradskyella marina TaxID=2785530 RepID=A0ABS0EHB6_9FLAO|nr:energy transducer TonB [Winogradskyella marina]MBF8149833.1 energy transducer TonB [Winogradskyella marina]
MKSYYSISIPKPCHKDWSQMTPNEKGRFCQSCSKSVIDFTTMSQHEIQEYLAANEGKKLCGRFKISQLEHIRIKIPQQIIQQQTSFHKVFLLALLIAMGTTLLNCSDQNGNSKKINAVEIVDTVKADTIHTPETETPKTDFDSITTLKPPKKPDLIKKIQAPTPIVQAPTPIVTGLMVEIMGDIEPPQLKNDEPIDFINIDTAPEFLDTPNTISTSEKKAYFSKRITQFVTDNYDLGQGDLGLKGKQRILTQFTIDKNGLISNIKIRGPHLQLEEEARRVLKLLPKFKPGEQYSGKVSVAYTLPITILIED